jgi:hypothetical protein
MTSITAATLIHTKVNNAVALHQHSHHCCYFQLIGFQGVQRHHKNVMMPKKKPKNAQLTRDEKTENRVISALRMPIEHVFAGLKRMNCLRHVYRNRNGQDDQFMFLSAGLWNLNVECR